VPPAAVASAAGVPTAGGGTLGRAAAAERSRVASRPRRAAAVARAARLVAAVAGAARRIPAVAGSTRRASVPGAGGAALVLAGVVVAHRAAHVLGRRRMPGAGAAVLVVGAGRRVVGPVLPRRRIVRPVGAGLRIVAGVDARVGVVGAVRVARV